MTAQIGGVLRRRENINNIDNDTVIFHFNFSESVRILTSTVFSDNMPWFRDEVRLFCRKKYEAFKNSVTVQYRRLNYEFQKAVKKN